MPPIAPTFESPDQRVVRLAGAEASPSRQIATTLASGALRSAAVAVMGRFQARRRSSVGAPAQSSVANVNHAAIWRHMPGFGAAQPACGALWTMSGHDLHHVGEIGVLRDVYRERTMSTTRAPASGAPA